MWFIHRVVSINILSASWCISHLFYACKECQVSQFCVQNEDWTDWKSSVKVINKRVNYFSIMVDETWWSGNCWAVGCVNLIHGSRSWRHYWKPRISLLSLKARDQHNRHIICDVIFDNVCLKAICRDYSMNENGKYPKKFSSFWNYASSIRRGMILTVSSEDITLVTALNECFLDTVFSRNFPDQFIHVQSRQYCKHSHVRSLTEFLCFLDTCGIKIIGYFKRPVNKFFPNFPVVFILKYTYIKWKSVIDPL